MAQQGTIRSGAGADDGRALAFGPADETIMVHAEEIAAAIRTAPPDARVRADARDDRTFLGIRVFVHSDEPDEDDEALAPDEVAYFWDADPAANAASVSATVQCFASGHAR